MRSLSLILAVVITMMATFSVNANNIAMSTCEYIAADDKKRLRSLLKQNRLKMKTLNKMVFCNEKTILAFADVKNSINVGKLIISKLPKKLVKAELATMKSSDLIAAANKRIN